MTVQSVSAGVEAVAPVLLRFEMRTLILVVPFVMLLTQGSPVLTAVTVQVAA